MNKGSKIKALFAFSFLFILCFFFGWRQPGTVSIQLMRDDSQDISVAAQIQSKDSRFIVEAFRSDGGDYYLFLPSWTEGKRLLVEGYEKKGGLFSTKTVKSGMSAVMEQGHVLTLLTGSEIPSVFLNLKNGLSYISADKALSDSGQAVILDADGESVYKGRLEKMKGRGNTSWEQDKKPFNITLENAALIPGMDTGSSEFALLSSSDISFLRNRISNGMAKVLEAPYVESVCINLYVDGSFLGVYEISQRIKPNNLGIWDLEEETEQLNDSQTVLSQSTTGEVLDDWNRSVTGKWWDYEKDPDDITGGYILEIDQAGRYADEESGFILNSGAYVVAKSPSHLSEAQYQYISAYMQECEDAMLFGAEMAQYIDIHSFVVKYLVEEVSKNIDCSSTSQYFYKDRNGVLYAGPVWDYDWAYGVEREQEGIDYLDPEGFSAREVPGTLKWWQILYYNDEVYQDIVNTYEEVLYPYLDCLTQTEIFAWSEETKKSAVMDYIRWNRCSTPDGMEEAENYYESQTEEVLDFLRVRKEYLRREWAEIRQ